MAWGLVGAVAFAQAQATHSAGTPAPALQGRWAGKVSQPGPRSWVQERLADGSYTIRFEWDAPMMGPFIGKESGHWRVGADGIYEEQRRLPGSKVQQVVDRYRIKAVARGCLQFALLQGQSEQPAQPAYAFTECPAAAVIPPVVAPRTCIVHLPNLDAAKPSAPLRIRIEPSPGEGLQVFVDDELANELMDVQDHPVRAGLQRTDVMSLNPGEGSLRHAIDFASDPELKSMFKMPFDARRVRTVRLFEIDPGSSKNKFGGTVLFESFDDKGVSMGLIFRSMLPAECKPETR